MDILRGYAVPLRAMPYGDHTYVRSSNHVWPCFGRGYGGSEICSGKGDPHIANCLSRPHSTAEIRFLLTGVCHQCANRILHPAGVLVVRAAGYGFTSFQYGTYGDPPWHGLQVCYSGGGGAKAPDRDRAMTHNPNSQNPDTKFFGRIRALYDRVVKGEIKLEDAGTNAAFAREELQALTDRLLGEGYDVNKVERLAQTQLKLRHAQRDLTAHLDEGSITPEEYFVQQRLQIDWAFDSCEAILGHDDCVRFMGGNREELKGMIDEEAFYKSYEG